MEGRASVSGVPSVDAFFAAVINFESKATAVSGGIQAELDAIRSDFGLAANANVGAGIMAQVNTFVEGDLEIVTEPARCQIDARASVEASARCEGKVEPGSVMVDCKGSCELDVDAELKCDANADLKCTVAGPSIMCNAECKGTCTVEGSLAASCEGTCNGECMGDCSLTNAEGQCQGKCSGTCMGSCDVEMNAKAMCMGKCSGECTTTNPSAGCTGGVRAECTAKGNATVECEGRCDGEVTPPSVMAECEASAKAEASFNAECTPPSIDIRYELRAGGNVEAQAKFEAAVKNLKVRLPKLLASIKSADVMVDAAAQLGGAGKTAVTGAIDRLKADASARVVVGLACAAGELDAVAGAISSGTKKLNDSVTATAELQSALGLNG